MEIPEALRQSVRKPLPEVEEIQDEELREKVVDAWALALADVSQREIPDATHLREACDGLCQETLRPRT